MILKMLIGLLMTMIFMNHPSILCMFLVSFCLASTFYLKCLMISINIYFMLIIFIGGILLLLFYLTMINSNKPSWFNMSYLILLLIPDFFMMFKFKFSTMNFFLENFNYKIVMILIVVILFLILIIMNFIFNKIKFMREF